MTYRFIDVADCLGCNLRRRARGKHLNVQFQEFHKIVNWDPDAEPEYPLKDQYDWFNSTFHGCLTAMAMDPAIFEKKKDRKGRLAYDQELERVEREPRTEEERARRERKQVNKVRRFAKVLKEYDIQREVDDYLKGQGRADGRKGSPK